MDYPLESTVDDAHRIRAKRITPGSLFGFLITCMFSFFLPFGLLCGVLALFGAHTVTFNGEPVTGISGLLGGIALAPLLALISTIFIWFAVYLGMVVRGFFGPITLKYVPADKPKPRPPL